MVLIAFKTDEKRKQELKEYAQKTQRSMSSAIKYALDTFLQAEQKKMAINEQKQAQNGTE